MISRAELRNKHWRLRSRSLRTSTLSRMAALFVAAALFLARLAQGRIVIASDGASFGPVGRLARDQLNQVSVDPLDTCPSIWRRV